jgi:hypothetical protein
MRDSGLTVQLTISQRMATHEQLSSTMLLIFLVHILLQSLCVCGNDCEGKLIVVDYGYMQDRIRIEFSHALLQLKSPHPGKK